MIHWLILLQKTIHSLGNRYCSHACAKQHWKRGGHKEVCASQDEQLEAATDPEDEILNTHGTYVQVTQVVSMGAGRLPKVWCHRLR